MLIHMKGGIPLVGIFGVRMGALIPFGPTRIALWVHGNLGFASGLEIHDCESYATDCKY